MTHFPQIASRIPYTSMPDFPSCFQLTKCFLFPPLRQQAMGPSGHGTLCSLPFPSPRHSKRGTTFCFFLSLEALLFSGTGHFSSSLESGAKIKEGRAIRQQFICKCASCQRKIWLLFFNSQVGTSGKLESVSSVHTELWKSWDPSANFKVCLLDFTQKETASVIQFLPQNILWEGLKEGRKGLFGLIVPVCHPIQQGQGWKMVGWQGWGVRVGVSGRDWGHVGRSLR